MNSNLMDKEILTRFDFLLSNCSRQPLFYKTLIELRNFVEQLVTDQNEQISRLATIGAALGAEKDMPTLLEMILVELMRLNNADGGTFYLVKSDKKGNPIALQWVVVSNHTLKLWQGGTSGNPITIPDIPLYIDGNENHHNASAHVALTGEIINLEDVYVAEGFDFKGAKRFDELNNYRTKSMLVIPLKNHENEIVAVLQLINALDESKNIIPFSKENELLNLSLAMQAAVAITNTQLIRSLKELLDSFIQSIAQSIDAKDEVTGGHISRVAILTMMIAEALNQCNTAPFDQIHFTQDELYELKMAAWLHDTGKITTPDTVMFKATKLEAYVDRIDLIKQRFETIRCLKQNELLRKKLYAYENGNVNLDEFSKWDDEFKQELNKIETYWRLIEQYNLGAEFLKEEIATIFKQIASENYCIPEELSLKQNVPYAGYLSRFTWVNEQEWVGPRDARPMPKQSSVRNYLTPNELHNLLIAKGTLNPEEKAKMNDHVVQTINILEKLPFPRKLQNVAEYAGGHHEFVNGKGYPRGLKGDDLPLQARIMALADVFEALSAPDRPYKKAKPMSEVLKILSTMVKFQELDKNVFELFIRSGVMARYVQEYVQPNQIDIDLISGELKNEVV
ncbi:MAG: HD domain-containing protein [bacterium]|nr:HD domain-containing protein [bacterium]